MVVLGGTCDRLKHLALALHYFSTYIFTRHFLPTFTCHFQLIEELSVESLTLRKPSRTKIQELYSLFNHNQQVMIPFAC